MVSGQRVQRSFLENPDGSRSQVDSLPVTDWRLPDYIFPTHYDLHLKTYLPGYNWPADEFNLTSQGFLIVDIQATVRTDTIVLHSDSLEVYHISVKAQNPNLKVLKWELNPKLQFLIITLNQKMPIHESISLEIDYFGKVDDQKLYGYYLTRSNNPEGEPISNAVTQFETIAARRMVPCFDEPQFKATWQLTLEYPDGAVALTNTIDVETKTSEEDEHFLVTSYKKTVPMSSYLLAVFIGDVGYKEAWTENGLRIRVFTEPSEIENANYALEISRKTVEAFETLFGIDFPMEKLDFVAVNNFSAGAMENWGLIVHISAALIGDQNRVRYTVIHELAHQWFGNLVTTQFWDQVWLNEGFATFMEKVAQKILDPEIDGDWMITSFEQDRALRYYTELPISYLNRDEESGHISLTSTIYRKGSSFIHMLEKLIGTGDFFAGIREYLTANEYQTVGEKDLYRSLSPYFNGPTSLEEFSKCWTHQNGHPVIRVEKSSNSSVLISQYTPREFVTTFGECDYRWDVPIWYQTIGGELELVWLERDQESIELEVQIPVIINANSNGMYRVEYSDELLAAIADNDGVKNLSNSTKFRLLSDANTFYSSASLETKISLLEQLFEFRELAELEREIRSLVVKLQKELELTKGEVDEMLERIRKFSDNK